MKAYLEIEMPENGCTHCPLARRGSIFSRICVITEECVDGNYERGGFPTECPLQKLQPHGRLIDADRLKGSLNSYILNTQCHYKLTEALVLVRNELLDKAPTVIPASEEG